MVENRKKVLIHVFNEDKTLDRIVLNLKEETIQRIDRHPGTHAIDYFETIIIPLEADEGTRRAVADVDEDNWEAIQTWLLDQESGIVLGAEPRGLEPLKEEHLYRVYYWMLDEEE